MSKKKEPKATETKPESDHAAFKTLPEETQKLMKLKDRRAKTIGAGRMAVTRKIKAERKSRP